MDTGTGWPSGYAIITGAVLVIVLIYTIFALKKQVSRKKKPEKKPKKETKKK